VFLFKTKHVAGILFHQKRFLVEFFKIILSRKEIGWITKLKYYRNVCDNSTGVIVVCDLFRYHSQYFRAHKCRWWDIWLWINCEEFKWKLSWPGVGVFLEGLTKTTIDFGNDCWHPGRDTNQKSPEYHPDRTLSDCYLLKGVSAILPVHTSPSFSEDHGGKKKKNTGKTGVWFLAGLETLTLPTAFRPPMGVPHSNMLRHLLDPHQVKYTKTEIALVQRHNKSRNMLHYCRPAN
jgi:hypothetical protein